VTGAWDWHPHLLLWGVLVAVGVATVLADRRLVRTSPHPVTWPRSRALRFAAGLVLIGVCMGWPLGDLAAHWAATALVFQRSLLVLAVAPLLLAGLSDELIRRLTRPAGVDAVLVRVLRPPVAVVTVTVLLVGSMAPSLVAAQASSAAARAGLALVVLVAGIILWLPIMGRIPGIARPRPMIRAVYLVAQAIVPVFLSFVFILDPEPLYPAFAHSVDVIRLRPLNDQQVAGFVSKLSFLFVLLSVAGVQLANAPDSDDDLGPEDPLVWADVERHFERIDRRGPAITEPVPPVHGSDGPGQSPATGQQGIPPGDADQDHDAGPGPG
jgi:cytochrome c oxidase assembly factor CtaG